MSLALAALAGTIPRAALARVATPATATPGVTADPALAARFFDATFNNAGTGSADLLTSDFVFHLDADTYAGPNLFGSFVTGFRTAFPDLHIAVQTAFAQGELVASRFTFRGTQAEPFQGIAATHRAALGVAGHAILRVADTRIAEVHAIVDRVNLLQQLGIFSGGAGPAAAGPTSPPRGAPPTGDTEAVARRFYEAFGKGDTKTLQHVVASSFIDHGAPPGTSPGWDKDNYTHWRTTFPDAHHTVLQFVASTDLLMARTSMQVTQRGDYAGIPSTGKTVSFVIDDLWRVQNEQLTELWSVGDYAGLIDQLQSPATPAS
jgi:predicted ester cyclase